MRIMLCTSGCCPELVFSDDGKAAMVTADRIKDDVVVHGDTVGIRFTRDQLQAMVDKLAEKGILPGVGYPVEVVRQEVEMDISNLPSGESREEEGQES